MSQVASVRPERRNRQLLARIGTFVPQLAPAKLAYGVKVGLALLIAVWIELWFDLGMADSAAVCVLVVKSNILGTTLRKSVLRMIGNLIGCSIGFSFIALFAQDRVTGTVVFSLYSVLCCFFLQRSRYAPAWHWIYDSAAIVFVFHLGSATESFTFTAERWLELSIGIMSMTLVSSILWPSRAGTVFESKLLSILKELTQTLETLRDAVITGNGEIPCSANLLAGQVPALRGQLETASRDTERYERFHDGYQALLGELQSLIARTTLLADSVSQVTRMTPQSVRINYEAVTQAVDHLKASLSALADYTENHFKDPQSVAKPPDCQVVRKAVERIQSSVENESGNVEEAASLLYLCDTMEALADKVEQFALSIVQAERQDGTHAKLSAIQTLDSAHTPFWRRQDVRKSIVCGVTIASTFSVWMLTNWPAGSFAVFFAVLITSKHCTSPYLPPKGLIPGAIVGILVGSVIYLGVLPALDGFWQLALVLFLFCTVGGYLMLSSNPKVAGVAGLTTIVSIKLIDIQGHQTVSFSHIVGFSYGVLGGTFLAFMIMEVMWPMVPEKLFSDQVKAILRTCRQGLGTRNSEAETAVMSQQALARASEQHLGLCLMWGKFLNYERLAPESRATVNKLVAALQSMILHFVELNRIRHSERPASPVNSLAEVADRLDQEFCSVLDRLLDALEHAHPVPKLPLTTPGLEELHRALEEGSGDRAERRKAACHLLAMAGQYGALHAAIVECHEQLKKLNWKSLNQSYF